MLKPPGQAAHVHYTNTQFFTSSILVIIHILEHSSLSLNSPGTRFCTYEGKLSIHSFTLNPPLFIVIQGLHLTLWMLLKRFASIWWQDLKLD